MSADGEGSCAMLSLKNKIQMMREQVDKYKDLYEKTSAEVTLEKTKKIELHENIALMKGRISALETETEQMTSEFDLASEKLEQISKVADDSDRARRALEHRKNMDEDRLTVLEDLVKETNHALMESERRYDDLTRKLLTTEADLERTEQKAANADLRTKSLEDEMRALCNKIKAVQSLDEKNVDRQEKYESSIKDLETRLSNAQRNNEYADQTLASLYQQIQHFQDELVKSNKSNQTLISELDS